MGDPAALADTTIPPGATAIPEVIAGESQGEDGFGSRVTSELRRTKVSVCVFVCV